MAVTLTFHDAAATVTASHDLLETPAEGQKRSFVTSAVEGM